MSLVRDAHDALIRFARCEWATRVPWLMIDSELCEMVGSLPVGTTLSEAIPEAFGALAPASVAAAPSSVPPVVVAPPSSPPSAPSARAPTLSLDTSSHSHGQTRVLVPPARTASVKEITTKGHLSSNRELDVGAGRFLD